MQFDVTQTQLFTTAAFGNSQRKRQRTAQYGCLPSYLPLPPLTWPRDWADKEKPRWTASLIFHCGRFSYMHKLNKLLMGMSEWPCSGKRTSTRALIHKLEQLTTPDVHPARHHSRTSVYEEVLKPLYCMLSAYLPKMAGIQELLHQPLSHLHSRAGRAGMVTLSLPKHEDLVL